MNVHTENHLMYVCVFSGQKVVLVSELSNSMQKPEISILRWNCVRVPDSSGGDGSSNQTGYAMWMRVSNFVGMCNQNRHKAEPNGLGISLYFGQEQTDRFSRFCFDHFWSHLKCFIQHEDELLAIFFLTIKRSEYKQKDVDSCTFIVRGNMNRQFDERQDICLFPQISLAVDPKPLSLYVFWQVYRHIFR